MSGKGLIAWTLAVGGVALAPACGSSRTADFHQGGSSGASASGSDAGGASGATTGGSESGGSSGVEQGGAGGTGGDTGGTGVGGTPIGGTPSGGGSVGDAGTNGGGVAGSSSGGSATGGSAGSTAGMGGSGGASNGGSGGMGSGGTASCNPNLDAIDLCMRSGAMCHCCPTGGPTQSCLCTTPCESDDDCDDPMRPTCNIDERFTERGICTPDGFVCRWGSR